MSTKPNTSLWTITQFVEKIVIPKRASKSVATAKFYRSIAKLFVRFSRRDIKCREVNEGMIEDFSVWLKEHGGFREKTAIAYETHVRGMLRMWNPERFPDGRFGSPILSFADAETPGTLENIFVEQYAPENANLASERTRVTYGLCFRMFSEFLGHTATLADLTDVTCTRFMRWVVDVRGNKPITAKFYGIRLRAIWNWAARKRMVAQFPTFSNLPVPHQIPSSWTREELAKLMRACHSAPGQIGRLAAAQFWTAFHLILWDTGERYSAMMALRWEWFDLRNGHLCVPAEFRKGGQKPMLYNLKPATIASLREILSPDRDLVFESPWHGAGFYHHYKKLVASAGLKYVAFKTGPQKMRRSFASFIEAAGGNATRALQHSDRRTTERSYLDPRICESEPENNKLFPMDGSEGGGV